MTPLLRKAVIPAAGLGSRFLPATKSVPKELVPLVDKPVIQYAVEEAVAAGIRSIVVVVNERKTSVADYFRPDPVLEEELLSRGKTAEAAIVRDLGRLCEIQAVEQKHAAGLGHAIGCAREAVGSEPFAVLLPDVLILSQQPCIQQLLACRERHSGCIIATREVDCTELSRFGILALEPMMGSMADERTVRVAGLVEKPDAATAPSRFGVFGRFVLEPAIFDYIQNAAPDRNGEIQITDVLSRYAADHPVYGFAFEGEHFDTGDKSGFLQATFEIALRRPALRQRLLCYLQARCTDLHNLAVS